MARPREFDRDQVVRSAVDVFREKGYEGTSTDDLLQAMGIGRQSMYDTFGDKRKLYLEALRRYNTDSVGEMMHRLSEAPSPLIGLENLLLAFAAQSADENLVSCMGVSAICEFGQTDAEVSQITQTSAMALGAFLEWTVREGKKKGEIASSIDERGASQFIAATLTGMKVSARAGANAETLRSIAKFAMRSLQANSS